MVKKSELLKILDTLWFEMEVTGHSNEKRKYCPGTSVLSQVGAINFIFAINSDTSRQNNFM